MTDKKLKTCVLWDVEYWQSHCSQRKRGTLNFLCSLLNFEVRHPRCVSNKSNCNVYVYIVKHNFVIDGILIY